MNAHRLLCFPPLLASVCGCFLALPIRAQTQSAPRIVLILCSGLTVDDLDSPALPSLRALARRARLALMNTAVSGPKSEGGAETAVLQGGLDRAASAPYIPPGILLQRIPDRGALETALKALSSEAVHILILSPHPPLDAQGKWRPRLTPVVLAGKGVTPGLLSSATTRTHGLIANIDIAPTLLTWIRKPVPPEMTGHPLTIAPSDAPLEDIKRLDRRITMNARALVPVFILLGILALIVVFGGLLTLQLRPTAVRHFAFAWLCLMNMPLAMLLAVPLLDWYYVVEELEPVRASVIGFAIITLSVMVACALAEYLHFRFLTAVHLTTASPCLLVSLFTVFVLLIDAFLGQPLVKFSLFSSYQITGIRFYGIGNEYLGVLIGFTLLGVFLAPVSARAAMGVFLFDSFVISFPRLGANAGGFVVSAVAFGAAWMILRERRATWRSAAVWTILGLVTTFGLALHDRYMAGDNASHAGDALRAAGSLGWGYLRDIVARKMLMNIRIIMHPGTLAALASIGSLVFLLRARGQLTVAALIVRHPGWARGIPAVGWGAMAALLFKDSGAVVALFLVGTYFAAGLFFIFDDLPGSIQL